MTTCAHNLFRVDLTVTRLEDTGRLTADISIRCTDCNEPFRFLGLGAGLSPYEPTVSIDGLELRAPIEPEGTPKLASHAKFVMPPLPPRTDS